MLHKIITNIPTHALKTAALLAAISFITTFIAEAIVHGSLKTSFSLSLGTAICAFVCILILHYFIFKAFHKKRWKILTLIIFPLFYVLTLISGFAVVTTLLDFTWFQVPLINQMYLQIWALLGKGFIYAAFSPKIPFFLTCIATLGSFILAIRTNNSQPMQD